jgi:hypothetical protein
MPEVDKLISESVYINDDLGNPKVNPKLSKADIIQIVHDAVHQVYGEYDETISKALRDGTNFSTYKHGRDGDAWGEYFIGDQMYDVKNMKKGTLCCIEYTALEDHFLNKYGIKSEARVGLSDGSRNNAIGHAYISVLDGAVIVESTIPKGISPVSLLCGGDKINSGKPMYAYNIGAGITDVYTDNNEWSKDKETEIVCMMKVPEGTVIRPVIYPSLFSAEDKPKMGMDAKLVSRKDLDNLANQLCKLGDADIWTAVDRIRRMGIKVSDEFERAAVKSSATEVAKVIRDAAKDCLISSSEFDPKLLVSNKANVVAIN